MAALTHPPEVNSGILTSWIPLTTAYPVVQSCSLAYYASGGLSSNYIYLFNPNEDAVTFATHCLPDAVTSWWDQSNTETITSLGPFVCPAAYTAVYSEIVDKSSTLTGCCPRGYEYLSLCSQADVGQCASVLPARAIVTYYRPDPATPNAFITTAEYLPTSKIVQAVQVNGYNFGGQTTATTATSTSQQSTLQSPTSHSTSPATASTMASTTASNTSNAPIAAAAAATAKANSSASLATGAIAGISVGVALSVIGIVSLLVCILYARRQKAKNHYVSSPIPNSENKKPQVALQEMDGLGAIYEVPGVDPKPRRSQLHEMDAT